MKSFIVAAASTSSRWGELDANLAKVISAMERAADDNARLLLLPECCITGANWPTGAKVPTVEDAAISLDSAPMREIARAAKRAGLVAAPGLYESHRGKVYVTQALVGPKGLIGAYRKVHEGRRSSDERIPFPVFDLRFARVGISICRDNMLPECARILALKGAEVLLSPFTSLPLTRNEWRLGRLVALRARAQDNRLFVVSVSHAQPHVPGKPSEWGYSGICCAVNPLGEVISESKGRCGHPQYIAVRLEEALQRTYLLADVPAIRDRRPALYRELADEKLQKKYVKDAPRFRYNEKTNRLTV
jgi:predicted amidohydrolase